MEFRLPELGEGITDATVVNVLVKPGRRSTAGQTVVAVETDKAVDADPGRGRRHRLARCRSSPATRSRSGRVIAVLGAARRPQRQRPPPAQPQPPRSRPRHRRNAASGDSGRGASSRFPNLGEGIEAGTIVGVHVKPGDAVTAGQDLFTIETDKASMPLPAEADGKVEEVHVKPGDKVARRGSARRPERVGRRSGREDRDACTPGTRSPQVKRRRPPRSRTRQPSRPATAAPARSRQRRRSPPARPRAGSPASSASTWPRSPAPPAAAASPSTT